MGAPATLGQVLLERYRVERVLGAGGMGTVVLAEDQKTGARVAIKLLQPKEDPNTPAPARFVREARAARRLRSEHVAQVFDAGTLPDGTNYIVMEYLEGHDVRSHITREGPIPVEVAVDIVIQACDAIAEAHGLGIVHRDLKPANLFLARAPNGGTLVKVLDFGISKLLPTADALTTGELGLTGTLTVLGSPMYMSPEQMQSSKTVDERTDIWTLGVTLYQMVSGKRPFEADALPELCVQIIRDAPKPLHTVTPFPLPSGFEAVVMRCLAKDAADRYQSVRELCHALAAFGSDSADRTTQTMVVPMQGTPRPEDRDTMREPAIERSGEISGVSQAKALLTISKKLVPAVLVDDVPEDLKTRVTAGPTKPEKRTLVPQELLATMHVPALVEVEPIAYEEAEDEEEGRRPRRLWLFGLAALIGLAIAIPVILLGGKGQPPPPGTTNVVSTPPMSAPPPLPAPKTTPMPTVTPVPAAPEPAPVAVPPLEVTADPPPAPPPESAPPRREKKRAAAPRPHAEEAAKDDILSRRK